MLTVEVCQKDKKKLLKTTQADQKSSQSTINLAVLSSVFDQFSQRYCQ
jgi:hypothetical protein